MPTAVSDGLAGLVESLGTVSGRFEEIVRLAPAVPGFFSLLFKARDVSTGDLVVLKFFDPSSDDTDKYRSRSFVREAELLQQIGNKPNILRLVDGLSEVVVNFTADNGYKFPVPLRFYSVEMATGSLNDYIYSSALSPLRSLVLFREVCKGVRRLHAMGIVHRDLKPTNCLLFGKYRVKVSDFGTARRLSDPSILADYALPVGHLGYTAPELLAGLGGNSDILLAADKFSLGAILFELLTGQVLTGHVYEPAVVNALMQMFSQLPEGERLRQFHALLPGMVSRWQLPSLSAVGTYNASAAIRDRMSKLYMRLSSLDYRERMLVNFESIFREVDGCMAILRHDATAALAAARRRSRLRFRVLQVSSTVDREKV